MKKSYLIGFLLLISTTLLAQYKSFIIKKIAYPEVEIIQIDFREYSTLIHMRYTNKSEVGNVIYINDNFYLKDNETNKKYKLLNSFNLPLGNNNKYAILEDLNQVINFTLEFEKVPETVHNIDLIEDLKGNGFNFFGVEINKQIKEKDFLDISTFIQSTPIKEMEFYYKDGSVVEYYRDHGLRIAFLLSYDNSYGTYYQANFLVENLTGKDINFNPGDITAKVDSKKGVEIQVLTYAEYMKKVKRRQNWNAFAVAFSEGMAASNAGYSTSTTQSSISGSVNSFGSAYGYSGNTYSSVYGSSYSYGSAYGSSTTQNYDANAAYLAQQNANKNIAEYQNQQYKIRNTLSEGYMKLNTVMNETQYIGYVNIAYKKTDRILISIPINGKSYSFIGNFLK